MSQTQDSDLVGFVRSRLDEDEAIARVAGGKAAGDYGWRQPDPDRQPSLIYTLDGNVLCYGGDLGAEEVAHMVRHDPARALREVAALGWLATFVHTGGSVKALRQMATIWADHPDYQPEWAPDGR